MEVRWRGSWAGRKKVGGWVVWGVYGGERVVRGKGGRGREEKGEGGREGGLDFCGVFWQTLIDRQKKVFNTF